MELASGGIELDRGRLLTSLRRWAGAAILAPVFAGLSALAVSAVLPPEYEATSQLFLAPAASPTVALQDVALGATLAASYSELVKSDVVLRPAMIRVNWHLDLQSFRQRLTVTQLRNTSIISLTFRAGDPVVAASASDAVADAFISQVKDLEISLQGSTANELDKQIRSIQADISSLDSEIDALRAQSRVTARPGASGVPQTDIQTQIGQLDLSRLSKQQTLAQLLKTRDDMRLAQARAETTVSLWQPASVPDRPVSPRPLLNAALAALVGGVLALAIIAGTAYLDDRLTDVEDVAPRLAAAPLGQVRLHEHPESINGKLFVRDEPRSTEAEAIRGIRTNILFASLDRRPRSILITSAMPSEGKSVLSANLALAFAEAGTPVVLVDADLRRPSQHRLFRISASVGLTNLIAEDGTLTQPQRFQVSPRLIVIPSGPLPPNPSELLASGRMGALLRQLAGVADDALVIVDSSPVLAVADPVALSTRVDGTIVVVDSSHTRVGSVLRALAALRRVHASVVGVVLNKLAEDASHYRYEGYYGAHPDSNQGSRRPQRT